jgi:hypothetical protein
MTIITGSIAENSSPAVGTGTVNPYRPTQSII